MRVLRKAVVEKITEANFEIENQRVRDEGKFTNLEIKYSSDYEIAEEMRPHIK